MHRVGLKTIMLAASLLMAGALAGTATAAAPAPQQPVAPVVEQAPPAPAIAGAPAAATTAADPAATVAATAATPADPTLNADGTPTAPAANIGQPVDRHIGVQPQVTKIGEQAQWFHDAILFPVITVISLFVLALLIWVILRYRAAANPVASKTSHNTTIEVVWTLVPAIILAALAVPSIGLLQAQFKPAPANAVTLKAIGNQWYWSYEYPDHGGLSITANMLKEKDDPTLAKDARFRTAADGPRLLATDNRVVLPVGVPIRLISTSNDVIHSWAMPAFWIKMDAVPGRLNEATFTIEKEGVYFGQCSELCGSRHGYMPIAVEAVSPEKFAAWVKAKGGKMPGEAEAAPAAAPPPATEAAPAANSAVVAAAPAADAAANTAAGQ